MTLPTFDGLRVFSLESRRAREMTSLITSHGGQPLVVPSMREIPLESNVDALACADAILAGQFDLVVLLTGVGTRALLEVVERARGSREPFIEALRKTKVAVRGPKPAAVMRELHVPMWVTAPEPNTWRELLAALDQKQAEMPLAGRRVAVQEYGTPNRQLLDGLAGRGAQVTAVPVYRYALPEDVEPLRAAVRAIVAGEVAIALFTTATQAVHLFAVAAEMGQVDAVRGALRQVVLASIGPTTSAELLEQGLGVDLEASHPKMGYLVREAAAQGPGLAATKRHAS